jgi:hypothetical protein
MASAHECKTPHTAHVPKPTKENAPMLDVHPAHHAASTWRDFFIHIATIVIGLVIAVALEQTVEAVQHSIERRELIADFHRECEANNKMIEANLAIFNVDLDRKNGIAGTIRQARSVNGIVTAVVPPRQYLADWQLPSHTVWTVAKSNGKAALLPDNLAQVYDRVDLQAVEYMRALQRSSDADTRLRSVKQRLGTRLAAGETLHLSVGDAEDLANALSDASAATTYLENWALNWEAGCEVVLHGVQQRDQMGDYITEVKARHHFSLSTP